MNKDKKTVRKKFERVLPVMKEGGYVVGIGHQTLPSVSLKEYKNYLKLLSGYTMLQCT